MFNPTSRTSPTQTPSRPTPAILSRTSAAHEAQEMPRAEAMASNSQPATTPEDWTRECLFDCYND